MIKFPIGIQLYSLRDEMAEDFEGTLRKVKEMGYETVEFAGLFGKSAVEIKSLCEEIGLNPISAHIPYNDMVSDENLFNTYAEIGCKFVVIPYLTEEFRAGSEKYDEFVENAKLLGEKAKTLGMTLCYHNHDFEFEKIDGEYALDIMYKTIPAQIFETEIDTCWVNVGGEDPSDYVRKYKGRANILHLKDFVGRKSENMYALIGIDDDEEKDTQGAFEFRPIGMGVQNFPEILKAAEDAEVKWVIVEQDSPSQGLTPLEWAAKSIEYLKSL